MQAHYKKIVDNDEKMIAVFFQCRNNQTLITGLFAIAFVAEVLDGKSPIDGALDVHNMRTHLIQCLESQDLVPFPKCKDRIVTFKKLLVLVFRFT